MTNIQSTIILLLVLAGWPAAVLGESHDSHEIGDTFSDELRSGGSGPTMVVIPDGLFILGGGAPGQQDLGKVQIAYLIALSTTEVTLGQYRAFLQSTKSGNRKQFSEGDENLPVSGVSWDEAEAYAIWLTRESGQHYRLPSASEWEYAARSGTSTMYTWGDDVGDGRANCMNCGGKSPGVVLPVGSFKPNAWGLYDMHGNVWEWTKDCIDSNAAPPANGMPKLFGNCDSRELRGGSAQSDAWSIRAGARAFALRGQKMNDVGFRVVRVVLE